jgi:protein gp37
MSADTGIQWTDSSWNPIAAFDKETGKRGWFCTHVSAGCENCYAEGFNRWRGNGHQYRAQDLDKVECRVVPGVLEQPLSWRRGRRIFVCSMTDLFLDAHTDAMIDQVFAVMAKAQRHTFQVLTKRPERMLEYSRARLLGLPLPNVWLGVSVESQRWADVRIPLLLRTPAAVRFLSCEPLLGPVDITPWTGGEPHYASPSIDWCIIGGESGTRARLLDTEWVADLLAQCEFDGVRAFVKQLGRHPVRYDDGVLVWPEVELRDSHGGDVAEWPAELRVRQFPASEAPTSESFTPSGRAST